MEKLICCFCFWHCRRPAPVVTSNLPERQNPFPYCLLLPTAHDSFKMWKMSHKNWILWKNMQTNCQPYRTGKTHSHSLWLALSLSGSFWLSQAHSPALFGFLWLTLALSGSRCLTLARCPALSGSLWLSLAPPDSLWLSQALSGSLRLSLAPYASPNLLTKPCLAHSVATALQHFIQPWHRVGLLLLLAQFQLFS